MLVDYGRIAARAALIKAKAGLYGREPPYSTHDIIDAAPANLNIQVVGTELPRGVTEVAEVNRGRRIIYYNRRVYQGAQRLGLVHGLHHHLTDLKDPEQGMRECNLAGRKNEIIGQHAKDPIELACDVFAGELLVPFDVLDDFIARDLSHKDLYRGAESQFEDEFDRLASRFNVPKGFIRWRLWDLVYLRKTNFFGG